MLSLSSSQPSKNTSAFLANPPTSSGVSRGKKVSKSQKSGSQKVLKKSEKTVQGLGKVLNGHFRDFFQSFLGHTPSTAGTFRKKFRKNSGKTPETLSERFLEFPSRVRLGCKAFEASRAFPELSPPQYGWGRFFFQKWFRRGPPRAGHGIPSSTGGISDFRTFWDPAFLDLLKAFFFISAQKARETSVARRRVRNTFPC